MREASDVRPRGTDDSETHSGRIKRQYAEFLNLDLDGRQFNGPVASGHLVRRYAADLLRGKRRRNLLKHAGQAANGFVNVALERTFLCRGNAFAVVRVRREAETDLAVVLLW